MIDFLFLCDIIVSFRTSFIDKQTGEEINDTIPMAKEYTKGQLTIDIFATIPFDTLAGLFFSNDNADPNNNSAT
jgi:hypothetical protein